MGQDPREKGLTRLSRNDIASTKWSGNPSVSKGILMSLSYRQHFFRRLRCAFYVTHCLGIVLSGTLICSPLASGIASAQDQHVRGIPMSEPIIGFVTAIEPGHITLRDMKGDVYDVVPASRLQIFGKDGKPATLNDIHVGDGFNAQGILYGKTIRALQAKITDPEMQKMLFGHKAFTNEAPAHPFVMGNISMLGKEKLTVTRSDDSSQIIEVDSSTKFYRIGRAVEDRPSAAHPHGADISHDDLKVGDVVSITGTAKDDVLVAGVVTVIKM